MDVASTFAVSVAPPPFQKEVEEARIATQNRVSIPKTMQGEGSSSQSSIGNRGNTEGENSNLNAEQMGILDAQDELTIMPDGRRKRQRKQKQGQDGNDESESSSQEKEQRQKGAQGRSSQGKKENVLEDLSPHIPENLDLSKFNAREREDIAILKRLKVKSGFDPITGYYEIPATRKYKRRSVLLVFRETNVKYLEQFSDKNTAVGLINFALTRHYGRIIPHCRRGQVVERDI